MRKRSSLLIFALMVFCLSIYQILPVFANSTWDIEYVDRKGVLGEGVLPLLLDFKGIPHLTYICATDYGSYIAKRVNISPNYIMYASWNGTGWDLQELAAFSGTPVSSYSLTRGEVGYSSLKFDSQGYPHIAYSAYFWDPTKRERHYELKLADFTGTSWEIEAVDNGTAASLALDSEDKSHIAYAGEKGQLTYAWWNGLNWIKQIVDSQSRRTLGFSAARSQYLALDSGNQPCIVYEVDSDIKFATNNRSSWNVSTLISNNTSRTNFRLGNLVLDSADKPHFSCILNNSVTYAVWNGSVWIWETVASDPRTNEFYGSWLVLDSNGNPHLSYCHRPVDDGTGEVLRNVEYAWRNGSNWQVEIVARSFPFGEPAELVLEANGMAHIAFLNAYSNTGDYYHDAHVVFATSNQSMSLTTLLPTASSSVIGFVDPVIVPIVIAVAALAAIVVGGLVAIRRKKRLA